MKSSKSGTNPGLKFLPSEKVLQLLESYPELAAEKLAGLRQLIIETAEETDGVEELLETTKWGEPSYLCPSGSTIRMDWKKKTPDYYYLYFICTTELVSTFRLIFGDELTFEGDRAHSAKPARAGARTSPEEVYKPGAAVPQD